MDGVVEWLESPEGEEWSRYWHKTNAPQRALVIVKDGDANENPRAILFHNGYYDHLVEYEPYEWKFA